MVRQAHHPAGEGERVRDFLMCPYVILTPSESFCFKIPFAFPLMQFESLFHAATP